MARVRVFIASASKAMPLAQALCQEMRELDGRHLPSNDAEHDPREVICWDVIPWWDKSNHLQYGKTIIDGLVDECRAADLAVTLLTRDDYVLRDADAANPGVLKPRDNCIFEAGLFMGGLGLEGQRSVLVTPRMERETLHPSDLDGIKRLVFPAPTPEQLADETWRSMTMRAVAQDLAQHVQNFQSPPKRPVLEVLSRPALIEREAPRSNGGDLIAAAGPCVVVNTTQPAETTLVLAKTVVNNMTDFGVHYVYFFRAEPATAAMVADLLQTLAIADLIDIDHSHPEPNYAERLELFRSSRNRKAVLSNLRRIREKLFIHFLPADRVPLLFCVHNANDYKFARCYLSDVKRKQFVLWETGQPASAIAHDLLSLCKFHKDANDPSVFYSTKYFDLYGAEGKKLRQELVVCLQRMFPGTLLEPVRRLCFFDKATIRRHGHRRSSSRTRSARRQAAARGRKTIRGHAGGR
jgi:hypothetical protein